MSLTFSKTELFELMRDFYTLTGIRIVLFDDTCREIFAYPEECVPFCAHMRKIPGFYNMCCQSDKKSFEICKETRSFHMYKCHAGLIECTAPIMDNDSIIGYIMFGQVSDSKDRHRLKGMLTEICSSYHCREDLTQAINNIKFKKPKQLTAASKILEACVSFILFKEMVKPSRIQLFNEIDAYISTHLDRDLSVAALSEKFSISRTRLYELINQYVDGGIASYIKKKRLARAKELLKTTDMSITEISLAVGFSDYNYFLRSFKKQYGASTKSIRKE